MKEDAAQKQQRTKERQQQPQQPSNFVRTNFNRDWQAADNMLHYCLPQMDWC